MVKKLFLGLIMSLALFGVLITDAEAKRFGGSRSFGLQRSSSSFSRAAPTNNLRQAAAPSANRWLGPLAGLVAGGLLASLFMGHGIGSGILTWLALGAFIFLLIRMLKPKASPLQNNQFSQRPQENFSRDRWTAPASANSGNYSGNLDYPLGFNADSFLREAKVQFNRLQVAFDKADMQDIRDFTTPEVAAEVQLQLQERGSAVNETNVIQLNAELLDVKDETQMIAGSQMQAMTASVQFSGMIQEDKNQPATSFNEIWHFRKEVGTLKWLVAGLQQQ